MSKTAERFEPRWCAKGSISVRLSKDIWIFDITWSQSNHEGLQRATSNLQKMPSHTDNTIFRTVVWATDHVYSHTLDQQQKDKLVTDQTRVLNKVVRRFRQQGIRLRPLATDHGLRLNRRIPSEIEVWDESQLHRLMVEQFPAINRDNGIGWRFYGAQVPWFRDKETSNGNTLGIMFDTGGTSEHSNRDRQGFAVFYKAIEAEVSSIDDVDIDTFYEYALTHEIGHVFNLMHSWTRPGLSESDRLSNPSFMNYPQNYTPSEEFWTDFEHKRFDADELNFLHHGHLHEVVMGGVPFGKVDRWREFEGMSPHVDAGAQRLTLRLDTSHQDPNRPRCTNQMRFAEPVILEAKLESRSRDALLVQDTLCPSHLRTFYQIQRPSGNISVFQPLMRRCTTNRTIRLNGSDGALFESVPLSHSSKGNQTIEPGRYRVQAYTETEHGRLTSNILEFWIRYPTQDEEEILIDSFDEDLGVYLNLGGGGGRVKADHLFDNFQLNGTKKSLVSHRLVHSLQRSRWLDAASASIAI